jgi:hypothetical protein
LEVWSLFSNIFDESIHIFRAALAPANPPDFREHLFFRGNDPALAVQQIDFTPGEKGGATKSESFMSSTNCPRLVSTVRIGLL